jgi:clan AA aspartic protease (TIGR02281 family)
MYLLKKNVNIIVLEAEIKGKSGTDSIKMALDTGATYVMIPWEFAEILGYAPEVSRKRIPMITASGIEKAPVITLDSITVLGKKAEDVPAVVHDLPQRSYVDGLLGLSYLRNFDTQLYFKKGILEIN